MQRPHLLIFYTNFKAHIPGCSHIGLGVNAIHTAKVLGALGITVDVCPAAKPTDIDAVLENTPAATHAVIEGIMRIPAAALAALTRKYPRVQFICRCHSQIGFLQADAGAVELFLQYLVLQDGSANFRVSGNAREFCGWIEATYRSHCLLLPNLYYHERPFKTPRPPFRDGLIRIGSFGAMRLMKHHTTSAAIAQMIAAHLHSDLEFWISSGREEHGGGVVAALRQMFAPLAPAVKLVEAPWAEWGGFRRTIARMDLTLQMSSSESFNQVTADSISEGVPAVVSPVIDWTPHYWQAHTDDLHGAARIGVHLLTYPQAANDGMECLRRYVDNSVHEWLRFLRVKG